MKKELFNKENKILTFANLISLSRIFLSIPLVYFLNINQISKALFVIILIIVTDLIDGWIARKSNEITHFGKLIDPVADKICMMVVVIFLIFKIGYPMVIFFYVLAIRDIMLIIIGIYLMINHNIVFDSNKTGKWFVFTTSLMMLSFILNYHNFISYGLYFICFILFSISTSFYIKRYTRIFNKLKN